MYCFINVPEFNDISSSEETLYIDNNNNNKPNKYKNINPNVNNDHTSSQKETNTGTYKGSFFANRTKINTF